MNWWGKLLGGVVGLTLGGPLGALLGVAIGHAMVDRKPRLTGPETLDPGARERVQAAFFTATFSVMGHLAKADGRVSEREIAMARAVMARMQLNPEQKQAAIALFRQGKAPDFDLEAVLTQFHWECRDRPELLRMFIEIQLNAAYADGTMHDQERELLLRICDRLGVARFQFQILDALFQAQQRFAGTGSGGAGPRPAQEPSLEDAYRVLGVESSASDAEVTRAYRRLLSQHHPDKLVAQGLPEEMMKLATEKTREIKSAYEQVKAARGL